MSGTKCKNCSKKSSTPSVQTMIWSRPKNPVKSKALSKQELLPSLENYLKNDFYAQIFLDSKGLELIGAMIERFPNGSFPNPTFRARVYQLILNLPINYDHLQDTRVGKIVTIVEKSGQENQQNLRLIKQIKDKWAQILCSSNYDHRDDEEMEVKLERRRLNSPYVPIHVRDPTSITTDYKDIEASQVRRMKRRYDFKKAPPSNQQIEKVVREKVA